MSSRADVDGPRVVMSVLESWVRVRGALATAGVEGAAGERLPGRSWNAAYGPVVAGGRSRRGVTLDGGVWRSAARSEMRAWLADALVIPTPQAGGPHEGRQEEVTGSGRRGFAGLAVDPARGIARGEVGVGAAAHFAFPTGVGNGLGADQRRRVGRPHGFGDTVTGSRVVIAVGMALQGRLTVGRQQMGGGAIR